MVFTTLDPSLTPGVQPTIIDNGGFEIWQRGTSFSSPANFSLTADRWHAFSSQPTLNITRDSGTIDTGMYSMKVIVSGTSGSVRWSIYQSFESTLYPSGTTFTASVRVWANIANSIRLEIGTARSAYHTGNSTWQTLSVSYTPSISNLNQFNFAIGATVDGDAANGTVYFDSAILVVGRNAPSFTPVNPQIDLTRCQRYYETGHMVTFGPLYRSTTPNNQWEHTVSFKVTKQTIPTVTFSNVGETLVGLAGINQGLSADTGNWNAPGSANVSVNDFRAIATRPTDQTSFSLVELSYDWAASADV